MIGVRESVMGPGRVLLATGAWLAAAMPMGARTVSDVVRTMGPAARERLQPHFERLRLPYPPRAVTLVALKQERRVELWSEGAASPAFVREYPVLAASGGPGPKLRQGDLQVPEGFYRLLWLNPMSSYHLSMKVDYPNEFDREQARLEGRNNLGGDIFIHGKDVSIGCLALGDAAIEELFVLVNDVGVARVKVLIAPRDLRSQPAPEGGPRWLPTLYERLARELRRYRR